MASPPHVDFPTWLVYSTSARLLLVCCSSARLLVCCSPTARLLVCLSSLPPPSPPPQGVHGILQNVAKFCGAEQWQLRTRLLLILML